jgi:hypothetical protein
LIQLDEVGRDIHDQRLGACATLVYCQRHTPPGISLQSCTWYYPMYWVCKACPSTAYQSQGAQTLLSFRCGALFNASSIRNSNFLIFAFLCFKHNSTVGFMDLSSTSTRS